MSERHEVFELRELGVMSFECPACKTEVIFHLDTATTYGAPCICPTCRETYNDLGNLLASYRDLFQRAVGIGQKIRLRVHTIRAG